MKKGNNNKRGFWGKNKKSHSSYESSGGNNSSGGSNGPRSGCYICGSKGAIMPKVVDVVEAEKVNVLTFVMYVEMDEPQINGNRLLKINPITLDAYNRMKEITHQVEVAVLEYNGGQKRECVCSELNKEVTITGRAIELAVNHGVTSSFIIIEEIILEANPPPPPVEHSETGDA